MATVKMQISLQLIETKPAVHNLISSLYQTQIKIAVVRVYNTSIRLNTVQINILKAKNHSGAVAAARCGAVPEGYTISGVR
jgi:hypothetical protein